MLIYGGNNQVIAKIFPYILYVKEDKNMIYKTKAEHDICKVNPDTGLYIRDEKGNLKVFGKDIYEVRYDDSDANTLEFIMNGKSVKRKIIDDMDYVFKIQKTQIKAMNGAKGLFDRINKSFTEQFMESTFRNMIKKVVDG